MTGSTYMILGYAIGLGVLWGYAAILWFATRAIEHRNHPKGGRP